ncbi:hypothetical protein [Mycobacterium sp. 236(2023)]|uniref:hypothetical protein n=1 Tax=Mycobacterium sp. 236(2023) TaxID=3038163 RepID=UPI0024158BDF|nr:hypothetical protein [Mycobacterium sp. 236(2023)]MDG4667813.1 hypothetical protein [Mycobacterium sp. 236(2023)]
MTATTETDVEVTDETPDAGAAEGTDDPATEGTDDAADTGDGDGETFPRSVVERLRQENGRYRQRAQQADAYAQRLHTELVRATGRLADPSDLPFDAEHLDDAETLTAAIDALLTDKPHLASRRPAGDIGQGNRGGSSEPFSLLGTLKSMT